RALREPRRGRAARGCDPPRRAHVRALAELVPLPAAGSRAAVSPVRPAGCHRAALVERAVARVLDPSLQPMNDAPGLLIAVLGALVLASSGAPGLFASRRSDAAQHLANALAILGSLLGLAGVIACIAGGRADIDVPSLLPFGRISLRIDALGAVFLLPI